MPRCLSFKTPIRFDIVILIYPFFTFISTKIIADQIAPLQENTFLATLLFLFSLLLGGLPQILFDFYLYFTRKRKQELHSIYLKDSFPIIKISPHKKRLMTVAVIIAIALTETFLRIFSNQITRLLNIQESFFYFLFLLCFQLVFLKVFIKVEFYVQHYVGLVVFLIGYTFLNIFLLISASNLLSAPYYLLLSLVMAVILVLSKKIMENKYIQPLAFSFYYGLTGLVLLALMCLIIITFDIRHSFVDAMWNLPLSFKEMTGSSINIGLAVLHILTQAVLNPLTFFIIYRETPMTETMLQAVYQTLCFYYMLIVAFNSTALIIIVVASVVIVIGAMIFMEYLIVHLCNMSVNTKEEIKNRALIDLKAEFRITEYALTDS